MEAKSKNRYKGLSENKYNRKGFSYYLMRKPSDKIIVPYVERIKNKKILEVGIGFGYYTKIYMKNGTNNITGADMNPYLGKDLGVTIFELKADELKKKIKEKYDRVLSFFMTEYLSYSELENFIDQGVNLLNENGVFATTIIVKRGIGRLYVNIAKLKGFNKYAYSIKEIEQMVENKNCKIKITPIFSICHIPYAILLELKRGFCEEEQSVC